jgi:Na+/phosphate symporter
MVSWVIIAIIVIAIVVFMKNTGFRYGNFVTYLIGGALIFLIGTFIFVTSDFDLDTFQGFTDSVKFYALWLGNFVGTGASITGGAVSEAWSNATDYQP